MSEPLLFPYSHLQDATNLTRMGYQSVQSAWCNIHRRSSGLDIERYRRMLMRNGPPAIDLAKADGESHPHFELSSVSQGSSESVETVTEGHVVTRGDM